MLNLLQDVAPPLVAHAGDLSAEAIGTISVVAGGSARIFAPLVVQTEKAQRLLCIVVSGGALALWAYSEHAYSREGLFGMVGAFLTVALATLGLFGLMDPKNYTRENVSDLTHSVTLGKFGSKKES